MATDFHVTGLPYAQFAPLFQLTDAELANRGVVRQIAQKSPTSRYPCRVSLRDAEVGAPVLLLNYEHLPTDNPYRSRYAIYVRENAAEAQLAINEIPEVLQQRPLSLRAFDTSGMLLDADLALGETLRDVVAKLLSDSAVSYIHVHNAKHGCYAARIDRAER